jgi:transitional endoplasmic reticulum ATPase
MRLSESLEKDVPPLIYENVGGLKEEIRKIKEMIELPLRHPELFKRLGVEAPKGVLLHGPSGTGKTLLAKAIANETNANFYSLGGPEIMSKFYGESEERLRSIFHDADKNAPSIIFIDEIDSIASKRDEVTGEVEKRVVSQLLSLMDGLSSRGKVVVIGATNRVNAIDPALRRPGRFDREIELGVPDRNGRLDILHIHTRLMPLDNDVDLEKIADITHGFVGADLQSLTKEAAMHSLRKVLPDIDLSDDIPAETLQKIVVKMEDFTDVLKEIEPSAMREVFVEIPDVTWNDVGGLDIIKQELLEAVEWPVIYRKLIRKSKIKTPKGIFLYGPPGTGKTLLAKAVANESQANFISIKGPELLSKWVGESEKGIREIFRKARQAAPCIIFFDEIDSIAPIRGGELGDTHITERVISQMLTELDGLEELRGVVVMAATNRPDIVDTALLRPGRFDRLLYIPPPDRGSRLHILQIHTIYMQLAGDVNLLNLADITEGYTGADIALFVSAAALIALEEHISKYPNPEEADKNANDMKLFMKHFEESMQKIRPLSPQELEVYKKTTEQFGNKTRGIRLAGKITEGIG